MGQTYKRTLLKNLLETIEYRLKDLSENPKPSNNKTYLNAVAREIKQLETEKKKVSYALSKPDDEPNSGTITIPSAVTFKGNRITGRKEN